MYKLLTGSDQRLVKAKAVIERIWEKLNWMRNKKERNNT